MNEYFSKWTWKRAAQLVVGLYFMRDYYLEGGTLVLAFGGMMFAQAVLNIGCFSSRGCSTSLPTKQAVFSEESEIEYEEIES